MWVLRKWSVAKVANLARIHQRSGKKFKWDNKRGKSWQTPIIRKRQILGENVRKNGEYAKNSSRVWPNIQIRWQKGASWPMGILRKLQVWQEFIGLAKSKTRWWKRHVDNYGFYENDRWCEIGEFGFIKGLAKILNETTKEAFLVCNHVTRRPCWGSIL